MRYKVKTNRVRPSVCVIFFFLFFAPQPASSSLIRKDICEKVKPLEPHTPLLSLSKKKRRSPTPLWEGRPSLAKKDRKNGPTHSFRGKKRPLKSSTFFSTREYNIPTSCKHFDRVSPLSRSSWCSQFYLSLSLCACARDSLCCCFCRRLSSRSTTTERERKR